MIEQLSVASLVRPMIHADLPDVLMWRNHPDVRRFMYTQKIISLDEHQRWFERAGQDPRKHLLIFELGNQPFGFVNLCEAADGHTYDWGFYVAPNSPKGIGRQLGKAAINYAFVQLKIHKLCGQALAFNERSIRLHQLLGFQQEGTLRDQYFDGQGYHNVICFGLLN